MNTYQAIMRAADQIEQNPTTFRFFSTDIPNVCGTPGCALGWIGFFADLPRMNRVSHDLLGLTDSDTPENGDRTFYSRMNELDEYQYRWHTNASHCSKTLRLYAARYHAPEKPHFTGLPDIVREIFTERVS